MNTEGMKIVRIIELPNDLNLVALQRLLGHNDISISDQLVIGLAKKMPRWKDQSIADLQKFINDAQTILDTKVEEKTIAIRHSLGDRLNDLKKIGIKEITVDGILIEL